MTSTPAPLTAPRFLRFQSNPFGIATALPDLGIYVACLAAYNNGTMHGAWIDLEGLTRAELDEAMAWIIATSPEPGAEEWAIHDFSGLPSFLTRSEWPDLDDLLAYAEALKEHLHSEAYRLACENVSQVLTEDDFSDTYQGTADSPEDFAMERAHQNGQEVDGAVLNSASWPFSCIDWTAAWRELEYDGFHCERGADSELYFFHN